MRLFQRIQVFALNILDNRDFERSVVVQLPDQGRYDGQARLLRRPPAPLTGDDFIRVRIAGRGPHQDRLQHALVADRGFELRDLGLGEVSARLVRIGMDELQRDLAHPIGRRDRVRDLLSFP